VMDKDHVDDDLTVALGKVVDTQFDVMKKMYYKWSTTVFKEVNSND